MMKKGISICISLFLLCSCAKNNHEQKASIATTKQVDNFSAPTITVLANLPDSLQPESILLLSRPKARTIAVPTQSGGFYFDASTEEKIALSPPIQNQFAVLKYPNGDIVKDSAGNPFIMGYGGKSHFFNLTTDNGLAMDGITCCMKDHLGNLWLGTHGGISRYDGKSFVNYTTDQGLAGNAITCMLEDRKGNLWFGSQHGGLSRYDGRSFRNFSEAERQSTADVSSISEDRNGNLWFATMGSGISRYAGNSFVNYTTEQGLPSDNIRCIHNDRSGNLWIGTMDAGVSKYDGNTFTNFSSDDGLPNDDVYCITDDRKGNLWFGTFGGGLCKYDGKSFSTFSMAQGLAGDRIGSLAEDKKGNLWIGTYGGGVSCYDGKKFVTFSPAQGVASKNVTCIMEGRQGHLWMGTFGGGLCRYDGNTFITFSSLQGLSDNLIYAIAEDRSGDLWFGTHSGGVCRYNGKSFTLYTSAQGLAGNNVMSLANDCEGNLWLGTQTGGVSRYDGKSFTSYSREQGLPAEYVSYIHKDRNCNLWFGTFDGGLSRFDGKSFVNFSKAQGLAGNSVRCIAEDKIGNLWIGTEAGLSRFDGKSFANFSAMQGIMNARIWSVVFDSSDNLWVGTENGLFGLPRNEVQQLEMKVVHFRRFMKPDGFPDNSINQILPMSDGEIAVGTNQGIATFRPSADFSKLVDIETYNSFTDCPIKDVNNGQSCLFRDSKGIIWASTGNVKTALVRFDKSSLIKDTVLLRPMVQDIRIHGEAVSWYDLGAQKNKAGKKDSASLAADVNEEVTKFGSQLTQASRDSMLREFEDVRFDSVSPFYPVPRNLELPYSHNDITIDFNAIQTAHPKLVKYTYKLEGYDDHWSTPSNDRSARFGNIREGRYTFYLKAQNPEEAWSKPVAYSFRVLAPWYRTWWAILAYVILAVSAMLAFSKWRQQKLRRDKAKLLRMVKERTAIVIKQKKRLEKEKQRSEELLLNILPAEVAEELKHSGTAKAKHFDDVTVLFTDFVDFTRVSERMSAQALIDELNTCFTAFDAITSRHNIEKIKTIGDAYLAVAGLPAADPEHAVNVVNAAREMKDFMDDRYATHNHNSFQIRIGIHSGSVVAGIVGVKKFGYDIWGDTVNTAARMEQKSEAGKINISQSTYDLVKDHFTCVYRGEIAAKNKGEMKMYFVESSVVEAE